MNVWRYKSAAANSRLVGQSGGSGELSRDCCHGVAPAALAWNRTVKHLFTIAMLLFAVFGRAFGNPASDQRDLTQLVKDLNAALVKVDIAFLERLLHKDYTHYRTRGTVENRAQYLKDRKTGRVEFESLVIDDVKVRRYGNTALVTYRSTSKGKDPQGRLMSSVAGPACSFGRRGVGSSSTLRAQRSKNPEGPSEGRQQTLNLLPTVPRASTTSNLCSPEGFHPQIARFTQRVQRR